MFALQVRSRLWGKTRTGSSGWNTFYCKTEQCAVGGGVGSTDNNEGLFHPSSRRRPHQFWHLSRGLGQDPVSGLAGEGRAEYDLLLRQWDLRRKWISSSHTDVIRQTCASTLPGCLERWQDQGNFGIGGKFLRNFTVNVKKVLKTIINDKRR